MYYLKGQKRFDDCGVAVVCSLLGLYGIDYKYKSIGNVNTFLDIMVVLNAKGISCVAKESKKINTFPCICQIKQFKHYHFVLIYEEKGDYFIYYSPNKLVTHKIKKERFYQRYTSKCINVLTHKDYHSYKICLNSLPYSIKLILIDIFLIILILTILNNSL